MWVESFKTFTLHETVEVNILAFVPKMAQNTLLETSNPEVNTKSGWENREEQNSVNNRRF